ncbi:iron-containing redox enzyme family protein [Streptomyces sp. DSM 42041]|uniref:Iron-containing redox enzyme family protein n=1 Tax=Streptomyces hazeniae TaxID=3075538 RepID=A0ABU2NX29_9ACTN|nr:iron-containing redox enzyme family protein [Streptomyces sp. DSM 42041]MDT0381551.1 iron-containing redox enzyme family protein [Streptomyces sp. DSM 42041]
MTATSRTGASTANGTAGARARRDGPAGLPGPRGPLSDAVLAALRQPPGTVRHWPSPTGADTDPFGEDLHLALQTAYELHYRGWRGVDDGWEWDPGLLGFRARLERLFLDALRGRAAGGEDAAAVDAELDALLVEPQHGSGVSHHLAEHGTWPQMREFLVHRSVYHLKEADPHAWAVPRLEGRAKAGLVAVEFDEFGGGRGDRMHSRLYADLMAGAGLDDGYLHYLHAVPAEALAVVNMMSLFGLHRGLRGALVGHFAAAEITTAPSARRMVRALDRMGAAPACVHFYAEHIEADAVHEQVMRHEVVADLLAREPSLAGGLVLGMQATALVEDDLAAHLLGAWERGTSSLRRPPG